VKTFSRSLCGPGGGGILDVVAGTGEVVAVGGGGAVPVVEPVVVPAEDVSGVDAVPWVDGAGSELLPPPDDTITATSAPAPASTATAAMTQAFFTRREATLAER
jgi:hypothetical protein